MKAILKYLVNYLCKFVPVKQLVANLLAKALNKVLEANSAEAVADYADTANCVFEAAAAMQIAAQAMAEAMKDGQVTDIEANEIVQVVQDTFTKWANGEHTPQAFKDKLRVIDEVTEPAVQG